MAIYIGTSGFSYNHWEEMFYPKDIKKSDWLWYYSQHFDTVEINSSFYRLPNVNSLQKWFDETPDDFIFSLKGSRYITHTKKLFSLENSLKIFFEKAKILGNKLPVILWQFPPNFKSNPKRLEEFLKNLQKYNYRYAFEFRHESWFNAQIYGILRYYNTALVVSSSPDFPKAEIMTADFIYIRFHGSRDLYTSEYSKKELVKWANKIKSWSESADIYAYFNNDECGFAIKNALEIKNLLE